MGCFQGGYVWHNLLWKCKPPKKVSSFGFHKSVKNHQRMAAWIKMCQNLLVLYHYFNSLWNNQASRSRSTYNFKLCCLEIRKTSSFIFLVMSSWCDWIYNKKLIKISISYLQNFSLPSVNWIVGHFCVFKISDSHRRFFFSSADEYENDLFVSNIILHIQLNTEKHTLDWGGSFYDAKIKVLFPPAYWKQPYVKLHQAPWAWGMSEKHDLLYSSSQSCVY